MRTPIWKHCHTGVGRVVPVPKDQSGEAAGLASKVLVGGKSLESQLQTSVSILCMYRVIQQVLYPKSHKRTLKP